MLRTGVLSITAFGGCTVWSKSTSTGTSFRPETVQSGPDIPTYPYLETPTDPLSVDRSSAIDNPVLGPDDVSDAEARFVADPFLFVEDGTYHLFFEVLVADEYGKIGHAVSHDGRHWRYDRIVLDPGYHLSFPYVFKWNGEYYMSPEDGRDPDDVIALYRATEFPTDWKKIAEMSAPAYGENDHVPFRWRERWWLLVGNSGSDGELRGELYLYYADDLESDDWTPHSANPVVTDRRNAVRPAGRPIVRDDYVLVFLQDVTVEYGNRVWAYSITDLSPSTYADDLAVSEPVIGGTAWTEKVGLTDRADNYLPIALSDDWNADRMHHIDPWYVGDRWLCAVDGHDGDQWSIGMYLTPPSS